MQHLSSLYLGSLAFEGVHYTYAIPIAVSFSFPTPQHGRLRESTRKCLTVSSATMFVVDRKLTLTYDDVCVKFAL